MAGLELLSDQGFRIDGRRSSELRRIQCRLGVFSQADGSAYVEQGNTKVLAAVYGPHEVRVFPTFSFNLKKKKLDRRVQTLHKDLYLYGVGPILAYTLQERERDFSRV